MPSSPDANHEPPDDSRLALWAALAMAAVWGSNFSVQKVLFNALTPGGFLFARDLIMPVAAALLLCSRHGLHWPRVGRVDGLALLKLGLVGHLLHVRLVTDGSHWSTAFSSSLILACGPMFTQLILHWRGLEQLTRGQVAGVAVAWAGVLLLLSDKLVGGHWQARSGDLTPLVAAAFFSYYTVSAPLMYPMPPVAGLVAWALTGERFTGVKLAGAALALAGVAVAQFVNPRSRDPVCESVAPVD